VDEEGNFFALGALGEKGSLMLRQTQNGDF